MKKFLKWFFIVLGGIILIIVIVIAGIFVSHDRYGFYPTGGELSELQKKYDAVYYNLNLEINSNEQSINGFVNVTIKSLVNNLAKLELDLIDNFDVSKIETNNGLLEFEHDDQKLIITLSQPLSINQKREFIIHYSGQPLEAISPPWLGGFNWSEDKNEDDWIGLSCQGEGGKIWFPCKAHPSDEPDSVAINITVPDPYYCASNGILRNVTQPKAGIKTYHWFTEYPTNNYNISINIAKYKFVEKRYTTILGNQVPVIYYYLHDTEKLADSLVDMAIDMLQTFEKYYGEYPFAKEKFGLAETSYLGMEHQTINSYGNNYRFRERKGLKFDQLMLHEMTHEWWGNKVTVNDWADFWIHEGIGTYSEALYLLEKIGEKGYHDHLSNMKYSIKNESPILKPKNSDSHETYSADLYYKGAYFMHSLRYALRDSVFFSTLYQFATDSVYTYQNLVETRDFLSLVNQNSGKDFTGFFKLYLETTDLPDVKIDSLGQRKWNVSIPNIDFELPMELKVDGLLTRKYLSKNITQIESADTIIVDPQNWYLHAKDFKKSE